MDAAIPDRPRKGRGAVSNRTGRFEPRTTERIDDGWLTDHPDASDPPARTELREIHGRTIITTNDSPDVPFDRSINPYVGCEHGCVYCFARPTHAYHGLSPGLDFETKLFWKPDAAALLARALAAPGYRPQPIALGANTDPYQPVERQLRVTRAVLEVLAAHRHPVTIVTKGSLVTRDLDLLAPMARDGLAAVAVSVTSLDPALARVMEPRASTPARRLAAIRALASAGVPTAVLVSPVIPALNEPEVERVLEAAAAAGATAASTILLRLPLEIADLFREWLEAHFPDRAERVLNRMRASRGGALYRSKFGERMRGTGVEADLLQARFAAACRRLGLTRRTLALDVTQFRVPGRAEQRSLF